MSGILHSAAGYFTGSTPTSPATPTGPPAYAPADDPNAQTPGAVAPEPTEPGLRRSLSFKKIVEDIMDKNKRAALLREILQIPFLRDEKFPYVFIFAILLCCLGPSFASIIVVVCTTFIICYNDIGLFTKKDSIVNRLQDAAHRVSQNHSSSSARHNFQPGVAAVESVDFWRGHGAGFDKGHSAGYAEGRQDGIMLGRAGVGIDQIPTEMDHNPSSADIKINYNHGQNQNQMEHNFQGQHQLEHSPAEQTHMQQKPGNTVHFAQQHQPGHTQVQHPPLVQASLITSGPGLIQQPGMTQIQQPDGTMEPAREGRPAPVHIQRDVLGVPILPPGHRRGRSRPRSRPRA
ncbi:Protein of unknown function [Pyronema omphalodes CBS 100304]|uniref:Uncharacterized protein n=1 Tax=Pyronema omphalodes (strain CBS 100304) TaxID=1076935 RepID=U4LFR3_PYROM|nr:Protein of unknown function [Pyronema omphalodes CBS 100304]